MDQILQNELDGQEVTILTASGGRFSGIVEAVADGVLTLEWKGKKSYIATERIEAAWSKSEEERQAPSIGFAGR